MPTHKTLKKHRQGTTVKKVSRRTSHSISGATIEQRGDGERVESGYKDLVSSNSKDNRLFKEN